MKLYLHIGTEKTGTTTIQAFLDINRKALATRRICVPRSLGNRNHRWLSALCYRPEFQDGLTRRFGMDDPATRKRLIGERRRDFDAEMAALTAPVVAMSSEHLQSRLHTVGEIEALRDLLSRHFNDIRIILYLRDPFAMAVSLFSTGLKSGATAGDVAPPGRPYVRQVADYRRTIEMWGGVFGKDALDVRLFERDAMKDGDLLTDFCAALGVTMDGFSIPSAQNKSLGGFTLALLRQINLQLAKRKEPRADRLRRRLIRTLGENMDASDRFLGTEKRRDSYHRFYAESNEWVRRNWFPHRAELFSRTAARSNDTPAFDTRGLDERMLAQLASVLIELGRTADK